MPGACPDAAPALTGMWQTRRMTFGRIIIGRRVG